MKTSALRGLRKTEASFSLVEVVLALGVVAVAIVAILGIIPVGLTTSHGAQDETRAAQLAQAIFSTIASQSQAHFASVQLQLDDGSTAALDLSSPATTPIYADNDGLMIAQRSGATYEIAIKVESPPTGFDSSYASLVTVGVRWPLGGLPANQTKRDFFRIISRY